MELKYLMNALFQRFGNKRYLYDLEILLKEKLTDLTQSENETLMHLVRDINSIR